MADTTNTDFALSDDQLLSMYDSTPRRGQARAAIEEFLASGKPVQEIDMSDGDWLNKDGEQKTAQSIVQSLTQVQRQKGTPANFDNVVVKRQKNEDGTERVLLFNKPLVEDIRRKRQGAAK